MRLVRGDRCIELRRPRQHQGPIARASSPPNAVEPIVLQARPWDSISRLQGVLSRVLRMPVIIATGMSGSPDMPISAGPTTSPWRLTRKIHCEVASVAR